MSPAREATAAAVAAYEVASAGPAGGSQAAAGSIEPVAAAPAPGRRGPVADDSSRIAVGLIRGLAQIPRGRARARECSARRTEVRRGLQQVRAALDRLEAELLVAPSDPEPQRHTSCLRWASQMLAGLHTAARTLRTLEGCGAPEQEYEGLLRAVGDLRARLRAASAAAAEGPPPAAADSIRGAVEEHRPRTQGGAAGVRKATSPAPAGRSLSGGALAQLREYLGCRLPWESRRGQPAGELPAALEVGGLPKEASGGSSSTACSAGQDGGGSWADSGESEAGCEESHSLSL